MNDDVYKDNDDIKAALKTAANYLAKTPYASKDLMFVSGAIEKYLSGEQPTLDHAFGLKKGRGQYKRQYDEKLLEKVRDAVKEVLEQKKPWKTICELKGYDTNDFQPIFDRYMPLVIESMADKIKYSDIDPFSD
jgi:hypothetical protein